MNNFNPGGIIDVIDVRDHRYAPTASNFDWSRGFDIEIFLGFKLPVKNQGVSGSCGGQALSTYMGVLEYIADKTFEERSARFIYSQAFSEPWGSNMRPLMDVVTKQGAARESMFKSYDLGTPPTEQFMQNKTDITSEIQLDAVTSQTKSYATVNANIDEIAIAIQNNYGCILGLSGENNGTWLSAFPKPPNSPEWGHWIFAGKAKMINGKKHIGILNSWGDHVGEGGWQWISEDYFTTKVYYPNQNAITAVWYGWTILFNDGSLQNAKRAKIIELASKVVELLKKLYEIRITKKN
jgi:hypothetical protein